MFITLLYTFQKQSNKNMRRALKYGESMEVDFNAGPHLCRRRAAMQAARAGGFDDAPNRTAAENAPSL